MEAMLEYLSSEMRALVARELYTAAQDEDATRALVAELSSARIE